MITNEDLTGRAKQIIEVAQKRFGLYGLEKTSMREIAEDLNVTKGSLYYYFPDKEHLYLAVIEKEQKEFIWSLEAAISKPSTAEEVLMKYVETRTLHFRTLINLSRLRVDAYHELRPLFADKWKHFKQQEVGLISAILTKGFDQGQFHSGDIEEMSNLYLDVLRGLRHSLLGRKEMMYIDEEDYDSLVEKTRCFTEIFIRGLKYSE
jgi:AcrR family transcriptional regulator